MPLICDKFINNICHQRFWYLTFPCCGSHDSPIARQVGKRVRTGGWQNGAMVKRSVSFYRSRSELSILDRTLWSPLKWV